MRTIPAPEERLLKSVVRGLSQRNYGEVSKQLQESFGMSKSKISQRFVKESTKLLKAFETRDLGNYEFVALVPDGKYLRREQVVIALGITRDGQKMPIGFIHTTTENAAAIKELLQNLLIRNFRFDSGILVITDGAKGMIRAVKEVFGRDALMQRCQWHKWENVVSDLEKSEQERYSHSDNDASGPLFPQNRFGVFFHSDSLVTCRRFPGTIVGPLIATKS